MAAGDEVVHYMEKAGQLKRENDRLRSALADIKEWAKPHVKDGRDPVAYERCYARIREAVDKALR